MRFDKKTCGDIKQDKCNLSLFGQHMQKTVFGLVTVLLFSGTSAQTVTVYRWVDKNNVVHFSQHQPEHNNYTELSLSALTKVGNDTAKKESVVTNQTANQPVPANSVADSTQTNASKSKCEQAKENVATLKGYEQIQYTDENGELKVLTELEKTQQLAINEKQVEVYCDL